MDKTGDTVGLIAGWMVLAWCLLVVGAIIVAGFVHPLFWVALLPVTPMVMILWVMVNEYTGDYLSRWYPLNDEVASRSAPRVTVIRPKAEETPYVCHCWNCMNAQARDQQGGQ